MRTKGIYNLKEFQDELNSRYQIIVNIPDLGNNVKAIISTDVNNSSACDFIEINKAIDYLDADTLDIINELPTFKIALQTLLCVSTPLVKTPEVYITVKANKRLNKRSNWKIFTELRKDNIKVNFN